MPASDHAVIRAKRGTTGREVFALVFICQFCNRIVGVQLESDEVADLTGCACSYCKAVNEFDDAH